MDKYEQLLKISYNFIPIVVLGFFEEFKIVTYFFKEKKVAVGLSFIMAAKFIVGNYGWNMVVYTLYPTFFQQWGGSGNLIISLLMLFSMGILPDASWREVASGMIVAEGICCIFTYIPIYILNVLLGSRFFQDLYAPFTSDYIIVYAFALISSVVLIRCRPKLLDGLRRKDMKNSKFWTVITITYSAICVFISIYSSSISRGQFDLSNLMFMISASALMMAVYCLIQRRKRKEVEMDNRYMQNQRNLMEAYEKTVKKQMDMARKFRHDIGKHLRGIELLIETEAGEQEQLLEYRKELQQRYEELAIIDYCKNAMINAVLYYEINRCNELGIDTEVRLQEFQSGQIQSSDLFVLIKRLFDLAILETQNFVEQKAKICLSSNVLAGCLILRMRYSTLAKASQFKEKNWRKRGNAMYKIDRKQKNELRKITVKYQGDICEEQRETEREIVIRLSLEE